MKSAGGAGRAGTRPYGLPAPAPADGDRALKAAFLAALATAGSG